MTDTSSRKITGLAPRREASAPAPLSRLLKSERDRVVADEPSPDAAPVTSTPDASSSPAAASESAPRAVQPVGAATAGVEDIKEPVSMRWTRGLRQRSRATFLATRSAERDETYSDMISKAVETELRRREDLYNGGRPFAGGEAQLPPGRPVG